MKNTTGSGGFRRLELAADRFLDVERVLAIVVGEISDRLAALYRSAMTAVGTADTFRTGLPNSTRGSIVTTRGCDDFSGFRRLRVNG
jgi:hypothetical protein